MDDYTMQITEATTKAHIKTVFKAASRYARRMWVLEWYKKMYDLQMNMEQIRKKITHMWRKMPLEQKLCYVHRAMQMYSMKLPSSCPSIRLDKKFENILNSKSVLEFNFECSDPSYKGSVLTDDDVQIEKSNIVNNNNDNNDVQQDTSYDDSNALTNGNSDNSDSDPISATEHISITSPLYSTDSNDEQDPSSLLVYPEIVIEEDYDLVCDLNCSICAPFVRYALMNTWYSFTSK